MNALAVHVAVAVIRDPQGRVLVALRPAHVHQGNRWEFPGGKLEADEPVMEALKREIHEELDLTVEAASPLIRIPYRYPDKQVLLDVWEITRYRGEARGKEGQTVRWVEAGALAALEFPPANLPIIQAVRLPDRYLITPEPHAAESFLDSLEQALRQGMRLVQLRIKDRRDDLPRLVSQIELLCGRYQADLLINSAGFAASKSSMAGIHLTARDLHNLTQRPLPATRWVAASCHDLDDIRQANALGVDFVVLGPVQPTRTHPGTQPMGWTAFAACCEQARMPVYALGGMSDKDVTTARHHGGQGIAAIRSLWPGQEAAE